MAFLRRAQQWLNGPGNKANQPVYLYSLAAIERRVQAYREAFANKAEIRYALKANSNIHLVRAMATWGCGADVVSGGELERALDAGIKPEMIVFSGVGKSKDELRKAVQIGIGQINVESLPELKRIVDVARASRPSHRVRIALRLNPQIEAQTHRHITTGTDKNKFGLHVGDLPGAIQLLRSNEDVLQFFGLAVHIGSQILDIEPLLKAVRGIHSIFSELRSNGWALQTLDIGGGLGIDYHSDEEGPELQRLKEYGAAVQKELVDLGGKCIVEPGRFLVARAGALLTQVEYVKTSGSRTFVIVNSGIHHLIRPALYDAYHRIVPLYETQLRSSIRCDIVGPLCESSDVLGFERTLPEPREGDWLAVLDSGAYGYSMASQYNLKALPLEVIIP